MSAVTPDLYRPMFRDKIMQLFGTLLADRNAAFADAVIEVAHS